MNDNVYENSDRPLVSVLCATYNQVGFVRDALDGILAQKTNFPFEVLVHDDASTDGTTEIVQEYAAKHPGLVIPLLEEHNVYSNPQVNICHDRIYPHIRGKYVAINEGDDYWTDPLKLQRQVDFLENNQDYSICFHPVRVTWSDGSRPDSEFPPREWLGGKTSFGFEDVLARNFIQTNSAMYRWCITPADRPSKKYLPGDWMTNLIHARRGRVKMLPEVMSVYRRNPGGIWWECGTNKEAFYAKNGLKQMRFWELVRSRFGVVNRAVEVDLELSSVGALMNRGDMAALAAIVEEFGPKVASTVREAGVALQQVEKARRVRRRLGLWRALAWIGWMFAAAALIWGACR